MYLKSLEIGGFKSFAKKSELEFSVPIVAIVGPNGSGKSNIAEAFRFVLGEQSIKSMRGKRGEDLIFTGTKALSKLNRASVRLVFDNSSKIFNVDFSDVIIERVVFRDGVNEYVLNGSKVRLKDIIELLASANIGASSHHIISQGEADRILSASIKERREMIEDALGLKIYQYKKDESERKLQKTTENIGHVMSLRREIAPHIKFLEKQVEKAKRAEALRGELIDDYKTYLKREELYLANTREKLKKRREGPELERQQLDTRLDEIKALLSKSENGDNDSRELLIVESELRSVEAELESSRREISRLEGVLSALSRLKEKSTRFKESSEHITVSISSIQSVYQEGQQLLEKAHVEADPSKIRSFLGVLVKALESFISTHVGSSRSESEKIELEREMKDAERQGTLKKNEEVVLSKKYEALQARYQHIRKHIETGRVTERELEHEMFSLMTRRTETLALIQEIAHEADSLSRDTEAFEAELIEAQALCGLEAIRYNDVELPSDFLDEVRVEQSDRKKKLERLKVRLEEAGGAVGSDLLREYDDVRKRDEYLSKEIVDLETSAQSLEELIRDLTERLGREFDEGVRKINKEFNNFFTLMFGGGSASLEIFKRTIKRRKQDDLDVEEGSDEDAQVEDGVDISVSLPNKRIKGLQMLSGGERALTSIALLFAISQVHPPPFIILDETDAALDEANSKKYGDMIENLSKYSQLILITHNRETMSRAGIIYGVTMGSDGVSKLLSVKFDEAVAVAK